MSKILSKHLRTNEGMGLIGAMLMLGILAVFALVAAHLAANEQKTTYHEFAHVSSFMSADSGGEAAIGWLRDYPGAPPIPNLGVDSVVAARGLTQIQERQQFAYEMSYLQMSRQAGMGTNYPQFWYDIQASGKAGSRGNSNVALTVKKQVQLGY